MNALRRFGLLLSFSLLLLALATTPAFAQKTKSGTTLAAYKTVDVCSLSDTTWRYSGAIAVWNEGAVGTSGLAIADCIQNKIGSGQFQDTYCTSTFIPAVSEVPAGTTQLTASTFKYSIDADPLAGFIRNVARITINNHSGHLGTPFGPEPKATWLNEVQPCPQECGCAYSQGYWKNHPELWPAGFSPDAAFYLLNGTDAPLKTWLDVLNSPGGGNGYYILAVQYIGAKLNQANGSCVPQGILDTLALAEAWLQTNTPGTPKIGNGPGSIPATGCEVPGSCGIQRDWGSVLDLYNTGTYEGGPMSCEGARSSP